MAVCIRDRDARHKFRNKYKIRSKFRKLRDDNRKLFSQNEIMRNDINNLKIELAGLKESYSASIQDWNLEYNRTFRVAPIDNSPPLGPTSDVDLAIMCIAKNEAPYLKEWIEYHRMVGVKRFYLYDNESTDNTKEILEPYIKNNIVVYHFLPNHHITNQFPQMEAYNDAIYKYRDRVRWLAIIDADEFIIPMEKETIPEFLEEYNQYSAVAINWVNFDSSGHETKPTAHGGLLTANYTRVNKNKPRTVKCIVNPKKVVNYVSAHYGLYYLGSSAVTENFEAIRGKQTKYHSSKKIRINHYVTKSREEYINKLTRNEVGTFNIYKFNENALNFKGETEEDLFIQKYVPKLKQALGINN